MKKFFKFLASLKLAVITISSLAIILAVGTFYETAYDAEVAKYMVYNSWWMWITLGVMAVNLTAVIADRYPWQKKHTAFITAHVGILVLLFGSLVSYFAGLDGTIRLIEGEANRWVSLQGHELKVYSSFGNGRYANLFSKPVQLFDKDLKKNPLIVPLGTEQMRVVNYCHYCIRTEKVVPDPKSQQMALQVALSGRFIQWSQWLTKKRTQPYESVDLGPARLVILSTKKYSPKGDKNELILKPLDKDQVAYEVWFKKEEKHKNHSGIIKPGGKLKLGWMDLEFRLMGYLPRGRKKIEYLPQVKSSDTTASAMEVEFMGKKHWVGLNRPYRFFTDKEVYLISYINVRKALPFSLKLDDFRIQYYMGTRDAASYESRVLVDGLDSPRDISMNSPLKHRGLTFYQASYDINEETGEPIASILSVNYDPGRPIKYLGSLLIVFGTILLFYFRKAFYPKVVRE